MVKAAQGIIPHLWYDKEASEAAHFYAEVFPESKVMSTITLSDTPSGDTEIVSFEVWGHPFMAMSAGPMFTFNPSISFMVNFDPSSVKNAREKLDSAWEKLVDGGKVLMPLEKYPFSQHYGWVEDKYGLSWQLILTDPDGEKRPTVMPSLLFVKEAYGKAEEAIKFYLSVFKKGEMGTHFPYGPGKAPDKEDATMFADFNILGTWFAAMDSAHEHNFSFNEAVSFIVHCSDQKEIDYYWDRLSAVPESEQCGWLKDKFGVSWQIVPTAMDEMMSKGTPKQIARVTQALLKMKKLDIAKLERVYKTEKGGETDV
ncbi:MAG: VOC family protein [Patescibacteria group bacterium]|jgi:predicted 3-demethylubiquinone-9 3-methyltransferase (glyoxalase superfamily)